MVWVLPTEQQSQSPHPQTLTCSGPSSLFFLGSRAPAGAPPVPKVKGPSAPSEKEAVCEGKFRPCTSSSSQQCDLGHVFCPFTKPQFRSCKMERRLLIWLPRRLSDGLTPGCHAGPSKLNLPSHDNTFPPGLVPSSFSLFIGLARKLRSPQYLHLPGFCSKGPSPPDSGCPPSHHGDLCSGPQCLLPVTTRACAIYCRPLVPSGFFLPLAPCRKKKFELGSASRAPSPGVPPTLQQPQCPFQSLNTLGPTCTLAQAVPAASQALPFFLCLLLANCILTGIWASAASPEDRPPGFSRA